MTGSPSWCSSWWTTPSSTPRPASTITLGLAARGGSAVIAVSDQGRGVPVAERERIFEPFARLPGERRSAVGIRARPGHRPSAGEPPRRRPDRRGRARRRGPVRRCDCRSAAARGSPALPLPGPAALTRRPTAVAVPARAWRPPPRGSAWSQPQTCSAPWVTSSRSSSAGRPADVAGVPAATLLGLLDGSLDGHDDVAEVDASAGWQHEGRPGLTRTDGSWPSWAGNAAAGSSGNDSTSVGPSWPMCCSFELCDLVRRR